MLKIFTDVLDPFLWGIFPKLRKYEFFYENFEYDFIMAGLIGNYEEFLPHNFRDKNNVELGNKILYDMYRATSTMTGMPGFNKVPNLYTDKYNSTYTLDKYYLTFKEIDEANSKSYLRKLLEEAILFDKNIFLKEAQDDILKSFNIDTSVFWSEYEMIDDTFLANRMLSFDYRIKKLPGFLIEENGRVLQNILNLDLIDTFILENMNLKEKDIDMNDEKVLLSYIENYNFVLTNEVDLVFGIDNNLKNLEKKGRIDKIKVENGYIYCVKN
ncbi:hypothetical protein ABID14_000885 [Peptoniphilus olsenii]|uniref:Disulfide bond formation protein DsbA n=1 Tax=Peptoniphilus olsenii TaxID=411570 RepID=A0ABV2J917_9FIRM